jgi:hypothetical protein
LYHSPSATQRQSETTMTGLFPEKLNVGSKSIFSPAMFMYVGSVMKCNRQKNQIRLVNVEIC